MDGWGVWWVIISYRNITACISPTERTGRGPGDPTWTTSPWTSTRPPLPPYRRRVPRFSRSLRVSRSRLTSVRAWFTVTQSNKLIRRGERNALDSEKHTSDRNELKNNRVTVHTVGPSRVCKVHPNVNSTTDPILTLSGWKDRGIWTQWLVMTYTWLLSYIVMQALTWKLSLCNTDTDRSKSVLQSQYWRELSKVLAHHLPRSFIETGRRRVGSGLVRSQSFVAPARCCCVPSCSYLTILRVEMGSGPISESSESHLG